MATFFYYTCTMFIVYIIYSSSLNKYYVGYTGDSIEQRIRRHNSSVKKGFTSFASDWELKYVETFENKKSAMEREKVIKSKKSRIYIEHLIAQFR